MASQRQHVPLSTESDCSLRGAEYGDSLICRRGNVDADVDVLVHVYMYVDVNVDVDVDVNDRVSAHVNSESKANVNGKVQPTAKINIDGTNFHEPSTTPAYCRKQSCKHQPAPAHEHASDAFMCDEAAADTVVGTYTLCVSAIGIIMASQGRHNIPPSTEEPALSEMNAVYVNEGPASQPTPTGV